MILLKRLEEVETRPEKGGNRVLVGAHDGQPAAPLGSARSEARDQDEAARFYGLPDSVRIGGPVPVLRQEVQDRPVRSVSPMPTPACSCVAKSRSLAFRIAWTWAALSIAMDAI